MPAAAAMIPASARSRAGEGDPNRAAMPIVSMSGVMTILLHHDNR